MSKNSNFVDKNKKIYEERISEQENHLGLWRSEETFPLIEEFLKSQFP